MCNTYCFSTATVVMRTRHTVLRYSSIACRALLYEGRFDVCVTVRHWYNNINSQLDATITNFPDNYNKLNVFWAIISPILKSNRLCLQLVV